jgi:hypothetical protein
MGIGNSVSRELVKGIAEAGRGSYEFAEESTGRLHTKILNQMKSKINLNVFFIKKRCFDASFEGCRIGM